MLFNQRRKFIALFETFFFTASTHAWTDSLFHVETQLAKLETISPPAFSNGTSFSNPSLLRTSAAPIPVTYTNSPKIVQNWLADNISSNDKFSILGFDVESVPITPWMHRQALFQGPATVQLATPTSCLVVHLSRKYNQNISPALNILKAVLEDETIIKAGAAIDDDMLELYRFNSKLQGKSRFDLGGIASPSSSKRIGLKTLVHTLLGIDLKKSKRLAMSNWSKPLTEAQINYSARDAWAGAAVLEALGRIHPNNFSSSAIHDVVSNERHVMELHERAALRKKSKQELKRILHQFKIYSNVSQTSENCELVFPSRLQEKVDKLKLVVKETAPDGVKHFDEEFLGFSLANKINF